MSTAQALAMMKGSYPKYSPDVGQAALSAAKFAQEEGRMITDPEGAVFRVYFEQFWVYFKFDGVEGRRAALVSSGIVYDWETFETLAGTGLIPANMSPFLRQALHQ